MHLLTNYNFWCTDKRGIVTDRVGVSVPCNSSVNGASPGRPRCGRISIEDFISLGSGAFGPGFGLRNGLHRLR